MCSNGFWGGRLSKATGGEEPREAAGGVGRILAGGVSATDKNNTLTIVRIY